MRPDSRQRRLFCSLPDGESGSRNSGGYPLKNGFGTIYSTNITPNPVSGIGSWSELAFARALCERIARAARMGTSGKVRNGLQRGSYGSRNWEQSRRAVVTGGIGDVHSIWL